MKKMTVFSHYPPTEKKHPHPACPPLFVDFGSHLWWDTVLSISEQASSGFAGETVTYSDNRRRAAMTDSIHKGDRDFIVKTTDFHHTIFMHDCPLPLHLTEDGQS